MAEGAYMIGEGGIIGEIEVMGLSGV